MFAGLQAFRFRNSAR